MGGKFEFCNLLYINLMEEIYICIVDMFFKVDFFNFCYWYIYFNSVVDMFFLIVYICLMFVCSIILILNVVIFVFVEI